MNYRTLLSIVLVTLMCLASRKSFKTAPLDPILGATPYKSTKLLNPGQRLVVCDVNTIDKGSMLSLMLDGQSEVRFSSGVFSKETPECYKGEFSGITCYLLLQQTNGNVYVLIQRANREGVFCMN